MIPRKKTLEGLYGDRTWFKQEMSLNDDFTVETTNKEVWAMIGIVTVALLVYYAVGYGIWNLAVYLTK